MLLFNQVAAKLNINLESIKTVETWFNVYFVTFTKGSPRFVSKKGIMNNPPEWETDPKYGFAEEKENETITPNSSEYELMVIIGWMICQDTKKEGIKWTTWEMSGDPYPRDIRYSLDDAKKSGYKVFHDAKKRIIGVLSEQI